MSDETTPINDGGPAFPLENWDPIIQSPRSEMGMSLRDWFAGQAVSPMLIQAFYGGAYDNLAKHAYAIADAMLTAREATK